MLTAEGDGTQARGPFPISGWKGVADLARSLSIHALSGFVAGVIAGGIGSRVAMRISAIAAGPSQQGVLTEAKNVVGAITLAGTIELIVLGGLLGASGGIFYLAMRPWVADLRRWRGLGFGFLLLAMLGSSTIDGRNFDFHTFGPPALNIATFASLFILFGLLVPPLVERVERLERKLPRASFRPSEIGFLVARVVTLALMAVTLLLIGLLILVGPGGVAMHALVAYIVIVLPTGAALLVRAAGRFDRLSDQRGLRRPLVAACGLIALPVLVGLGADVRSIVQIVSAG